MDWKEHRIEELYLGFYDGPHATPQPSEEGPVFLGIKNITEDGKLDFSEIRHISNEEYPRWIRRVNPTFPDIVFSYEATLHRYAIIPKGFKGCLGRRMALIRPNPKVVDYRFLYHYFFTQSWYKEVSNYMISGSTVDRIPLTDFPKFNVYLPALPTQRRIADILSAYDDLIENNQRRMAILEKMAQNLYQEWFVRLRFPGHEQVKVVNGVPEGWASSNIGNIAKEVRRNVNVSDIKNEIRYVGLEHIPRKSMVLTNWEDVNAIGSNKLAFKKGEILFGKIRPYFHKVAVAPFEGICSSDTIVLDVKQPLYYSLLLSVVTSDHFVAHASKTAKGTKMPRAEWKVMKAFPICVPSDFVFEKFNQAIEPMLNQMQVLVAKNHLLRQARNRLLPRLMGGKLEV